MALWRLAAGFALLAVVAYGQPQGLSIARDLCPDGSHKIVCITFPCDVCPKDRPRFCSLPSDTGPCKALFRRWYYNAKSGKCEQFTYGGCQGNKNNFETERECKTICKPAPTPPTDTCKLKSDSGPCEAAIRRWFFNFKTGKCEIFIYGGCQGNSNNFQTEKDCAKRCGAPLPPPPPPVDVCKLDSDVGPCDGAFPRWYFDKRSGRCKEFSYGGCGGNKNNFKTARECAKKCGGSLPPPPVPVDICKLPSETGPCRAAIKRWFFNSKTGNCETFTYGGCKGNKNNFETVEECKKACGGGDLPGFCSKLGKPCTSGNAFGQLRCCPGLSCCFKLGPITPNQKRFQRFGTCGQNCLFG